MIYRYRQEGTRNRQRGYVIWHNTADTVQILFMAIAVSAKSGESAWIITGAKGPTNARTLSLIRQMLYAKIL